MAVNLKTATPDTTLPTAGFLFGADSQSASAPSVYPLSALAQTLLGATAFSGDTVTASKPLLDMAQTWNNAAVTFTADKINVTNTASNAASLIFDRQVGGVSKASIDITGKFSASTVLLSGGSSAVPTVSQNGNSGFFFGNSGYTIGVSYAGSQWATFGFTQFRVGSTSTLGWANDSGGANAADVILARDAANILGLRNGTNAQAFNVYNTYTDASNYERLGVRWSSNVAYLGPQKAGTGSDRLMVVQTGIVAVASLPDASTAGAGARAMVSDATATTFASTVSGGGANKVPVVSDGTNWIIG